jgi:hypothetical protein
MPGSSTRAELQITRRRARESRHAHARTTPSDPSNQRERHHYTTKFKPSRHPHSLPNDVRLRLALGTIIIDLLARQAPHPAYRHTQPSPPTLIYQKHSYHLPQYPGCSPYNHHNHNPSHHTATTPPRDIPSEVLPFLFPIVMPRYISNPQ